MLGMFEGRIAKLGMLQPMARITATPMRPFDPLAKPRRAASAMPIGTMITARPTEDGITKPRIMVASINPAIRRV